jgi:transposase
MDMTMSSIWPNRVEVVTSVQRRRRWTPEQKLDIVKQTNEPGSSVSLVARHHGLTAAQLFMRAIARLGLQGLLLGLDLLTQLEELKRNFSKQIKFQFANRNLNNQVLQKF